MLPFEQINASLPPGSSISISQAIGCKDCLRNDLGYVT